MHQPLKILEVPVLENDVLKLLGLGLVQDLSIGFGPLHVEGAEDRAFGNLCQVLHQDYYLWLVPFVKLEFVNTVDLRNQGLSVVAEVFVIFW